MILAISTSIHNLEAAYASITSKSPLQQFARMLKINGLSGVGAPSCKLCEIESDAKNVIHIFQFYNMLLLVLGLRINKNKATNG